MLQQPPWSAVPELEPTGHDATRVLVPVDGSRPVVVGPAFIREDP